MRGFDSLRSAGAESKPFLAAQIRTGGRVLIFDHGVRREMKIGGTVRAKRAQMAEELDGLQFASELEFQHIANREIVACGEGQRLQSGIVQVGIGGGEAADGQRYRRLGTICQAA